MDWLALAKIIGIDIILSGDNAVVIAMAAHALPARDRKRAVLLGAGAAVVMRILLATVALQLLEIPGLKLVGAALLLWVAVKLLATDDEAESGVATSIGHAIRLIVIADVSMSLDNVLAVAAASNGHAGLLVIGLALSIPLVLFTSTLLMNLMDRFPVIVSIGAGLLGYVAGEMAVTDPLVHEIVMAHAPWVDVVIPALGVCCAVGGGHLHRNLNRSMA